jgi:apolipoprotein N-acyltransferase
MLKTSSSFAAKLASPRFFQTRAGAVTIAFLGGICMGLTPAPAHLWPLAWVAIAPLWFLLFRNPSLSLRRGLMLCLAWGVGYHGLALSWITDLHPLTWMGIPWLGSVAITLFAWGFITLWGALLVMSWYLGVRSLNQLAIRAHGNPSQISPVQQSPTWFRILSGTAIWCAVEQLWSEGALYWTSISYTQSPYNLPILHLGQLSGPLTVTAILVAFNACLAEILIHRSRSPLHGATDTHPLTHSSTVRLSAHVEAHPPIHPSTHPPIHGSAHRSPQRPSTHLSTLPLLPTALSLLLLSHLLGLYLYLQPLQDTPDRALKVGIVQGNVPTRIKLFEEGIQLSLKNYTSGYETLAAQGVDAVLTPEGALPWLWVDTPRQSQNILYQAILRQGVTAWVGTVGRRQGRMTQNLFTITGTGQIYSGFEKIKLVPLGEYIPFESVLGHLMNRLSPLGDSMLPGRPDQVFETPFGRAIAAICYESAFPQVFQNQAAQGGQFILTASNNDPYKAAMMAQHHAQDTMRAIETNRWAVRATNTGFSGVVDPHGRTQWISGFRTFETHAHTIYRRTSQNPYIRWGNWLTPLLLGLTALGLLGLCFFQANVAGPRF